MTTRLASQLFASHNDRALAQILSDRAPNVTQWQISAALQYFHGLLGRQLPLSPLGVSLSGSLAKGTANAGGTDLDLFVSMNPGSLSLSDLFAWTDRILRAAGFTCRVQGVSLRVQHQGLSVDIVPARQQGILGMDHSLYVVKTQTWTKTNVGMHIDQVRRSGLADVIRVMKLWRDAMDLDISSFLVERLVLDTPGLRSYPGLATKCDAVLSHVANRIEVARVMDPANTANNLADTLTATEKARIAGLARATVGAPSLAAVIR